MMQSIIFWRTDLKKRYKITNTVSYVKLVP